MRKPGWQICEFFPKFPKIPENSDCPHHVGHGKNTFCTNLQKMCKISRIFTNFRKFRKIPGNFRKKGFFSHANGVFTNAIFTTNFTRISRNSRKFPEIPGNSRKFHTKNMQVGCEKTKFVTNFPKNVQNSGKFPGISEFPKIRKISTSKMVLAVPNLYFFRWISRHKFFSEFSGISGNSPKFHPKILSFSARKPHFSRIFREFPEFPEFPGISRISGNLRNFVVEIFLSVLDLLFFGCIFRRNLTKNRPKLAENFSKKWILRRGFRPFYPKFSTQKGLFPNLNCDFGVFFSTPKFHADFFLCLWPACSTGGV